MKKRVLITGGAGSIGTEIVKQIAKSKPKEIIVLDTSELNIYRINKIFDINYNGKFFFHALIDQ